MKLFLLQLVIICFSIEAKCQFANISWQKAYGGSNGEESKNIIQTNDGGYLMVGWSSSYDGDVLSSNSENYPQGWVVKVDSIGNIMWEQVYENAISINGASLLVDESIIIIGKATIGGWYISRLNPSNGNIYWEKYLAGGYPDDSPSDIVTDHSGYGVVIVGTIMESEGYPNPDVLNTHGSFDYWIVKIDILGDLIWQYCAGGSYMDFGYSVDLTDDAGFIFAGKSGSSDGMISSPYEPGSGDFDGWLVKLDLNGNFMWEKSVGSSGYEWANSIEQTIDGGYILAGTEYNGYDGIIWKLDDAANIEWSKDFPQEVVDISQTVNSHYIYTLEFSRLGIIDDNGNETWSTDLGDYGTGGYSNASDVLIDSDGDYLWFGYTSCNETNSGQILYNHGSFDFLLVKYNKSTVGISELNSNKPKELIKIVNLLGQEVEYTPNNVLIYQYSDGTSEKVFTIED